MTEHMSAAQYKALMQEAKPGKPSKYRNVRTEVDGIRFDSKAEAYRYVELRNLERSDYIRGLKLQPVFPLSAVSPDNVWSEVGTYVADFEYSEWDDIEARWIKVVEDVKGGKGTQTDLFKWKRKHFEIQYNITIRIAGAA